jgi:hypothetical protein
VDGKKTDVMTNHTASRKIGGKKIRSRCSYFSAPDVSAFGFVSEAATSTPYSAAAGATKLVVLRMRRPPEMPYYDFLWTDEIIAHLAEHDIEPRDFEKVVMNPVDVDQGESSGSPAAFGYTWDGRFIIAVFEYVDEMTILPVTAYEVPEPR